MSENVRAAAIEGNDEIVWDGKPYVVIGAWDVQEGRSAMRRLHLRSEDGVGRYVDTAREVMIEKTGRRR